MNKEELLTFANKQAKQAYRYRGRFSELMESFKALQKEKEKFEAALQQSQDKSMQKIAEMKEVQQLDQQAKAHLEESFQTTLEEKDHTIAALQTQVN
jgi:predicted RNase H-like nuclease (RuvC/YqgF family)